MTIPKVPTPGYEPGEHDTLTDRIADWVMIGVCVLMLLFMVFCVVLVVLA
jgi:hypothetical protein